MKNKDENGWKVDIKWDLYTSNQNLTEEEEEKLNVSLICQLRFSASIPSVSGNSWTENDSTKEALQTLGESFMFQI